MNFLLFSSHYHINVAVTYPTYQLVGTFHKAYLVTLSTSETLILRVARRFMPRLKVESEVATIAYLRRYTKIPVPEVFAWDSSPFNRLGGEWIMMSRVSICVYFNIQSCSLSVTILPFVVILFLPSSAIPILSFTCQLRSLYRVYVQVLSIWDERSCQAGGVSHPEELLLIARVYLSFLFLIQFSHFTSFTNYGIAKCFYVLGPRSPSSKSILFNAY